MIERYEYKPKNKISLIDKHSLAISESVDSSLIITISYNKEYT